MDKKERAKNILKILDKKYKYEKIELEYNTLYQLMIAVILSAQCTDKRVNEVTKKLFKVVKEPIDIYKMDVENLKKYIFSTGFYINKANNIKENARQIIEDYNGLIPEDFKSLIKLKGVGRKTANVIMGAYFNKNTGVVVDTHVKRISKLLGLVKSDTPDKIENELKKIIDKKDWFKFSHTLILHGRSVCIARRPMCKTCEIKSLCAYGKNINDEI